jgi:hypothetical protein
MVTIVIVIMSPVSLDSGYGPSAEYLHLLSLPMWQGLRGRVAAALAGVGPHRGALVELGAGTGLGTEVLLDTVPGAPLVVAEPSAHLRAVLIARLAARPDAARITVQPLGASDLPLPERIAAVAALHMIGHLAPAERRALFRTLAPRLSPGAPVVINVQPPDTAVEVPEFPPVGVTVGTLRYEGTGSATPVGPDRLRWTMRYRTLAGDQVLTTATATYEWWTVPADTLAAELTAAGLKVERDPDVYGDDLVVARG